MRRRHVDGAHAVTSPAHPEGLLIPGPRAESDPLQGGQVMADPFEAALVDPREGRPQLEGLAAIQQFHDGAPADAPVATSRLERYRTRGHDVTDGVGRAMLAGVMDSRPVRAIRETLRDASDITVGAVAETTDTTRVGASSRTGRAAAAFDRFAASGGAAKELRSASGVLTQAERVVRNDRKHRNRSAKHAEHATAASQALHDHEVGTAIRRGTGAIVEGTKAAWSDWRVRVAEKKLGRKGRELDDRTAVVEGRLERGRGRVARGDERRAAVGLDALQPTQETFGRLGRRDIVDHARERRDAAQLTLSARMLEAANRAARRATPVEQSTEDHE